MSIFSRKKSRPDEPKSEQPSKTERPDSGGKRRKRVPLGTIRTKLQVEPIEGYKFRWVNDEENRIPQAEQGGYEFTTYDELAGRPIGQHDTAPTSVEMGSKVSKVVGTQENGAPLTAYLMKIKQEWYDEDQAEKQKYIDAVEQGLINLEGVPESDSMYGEIKIG